MHHSFSHPNCTQSSAVPICKTRNNMNCVQFGSPVVDISHRSHQNGPVLGPGASSSSQKSTLHESKVSHHSMDKDTHTYIYCIYIYCIYIYIVYIYILYIYIYICLVYIYMTMSNLEGNRAFHICWAFLGRCYSHVKLRF